MFDSTAVPQFVKKNVFDLRDARVSAGILAFKQMSEVIEAEVDRTSWIRNTK
jgi:hypothetical protein